MMESKLKIKDKLEDNTLDLSWCDLDEVPIREIATIKKATNLDLSNNQLVSLPKTIVMLTNITKLDLSKNMLTEIPENIGEMKQLKHLDLYSNQISRLPLSLGDLKNLKWLDLKENPLTPAVASVAGLCSNSSECQACARNIVKYLIQIKATIEQEKLRRSIAAPAATNGTKKEKKKKKKKYVLKDGQNSQQTLLNQNSETSDANPIDSFEEEEVNDDTQDSRGFCAIFCELISTAIMYTILVSILMFVIIIILMPKLEKIILNDYLNYLPIETRIQVQHYFEIGIRIIYKTRKYLVKNFSKIYSYLYNIKEAF